MGTLSCRVFKSRWLVCKREREGRDLPLVALILVAQHLAFFVCGGKKEDIGGQNGQLSSQWAVRLRMVAVAVQYAVPRVVTTLLRQEPHPFTSTTNRSNTGLGVLTGLARVHASNPNPSRLPVCLSILKL